jgi:hypothetical protein
LGVNPHQKHEYNDGVSVPFGARRLNDRDVEMSIIVDVCRFAFERVRKPSSGVNRLVARMFGLSGREMKGAQSKQAIEAIHVNETTILLMIFRVSNDGVLGGCRRLISK